MKYIEKRLSKKRFVHTVSTANCSLFFNGFLGLKISENSIIAASLGHDMSKWMTETEMKDYISANSIYLDEFEKKHPEIWHPAVSEFLLKNEFGVDDAEILEAVRLHTIGAEKMSDLSKLLYCADYFEPSRNFFVPIDFSLITGLQELFELAAENKLKRVKSTEKNSRGIIKLLTEKK
ncbi:MAG TPA: bis(5'-nucleosyl)-tetraphosphatase (symmetrical) YqeK [bacterium]|nr:bis(5'-nucleosyl)-tetraphosphatase (symmetrical) YqeK [bacterium]